MKSLMKGIADLPKRYAQILFAKLGALIILFALLIILTIFLAFVMITKWQWSALLTFAVCFSPWIIALIAFIVMALVNSAKFEEEKQEVYDLGKQQLVIQGLSLAVAFLKGRKSRKSKKTKDVDEE